MWAQIITLVLLGTQLSLSQESEIDSLKRLIQERPPDTTTVNILFDIAWKSRLSNIDELRVYGQKALDLSRNLHYRPGFVLGLKILGMGQAMTGDNKAALTCFQEALLIAQSIDWQDEISILHNAIGVSFNNLGNYEKALEYYLKSAAAFEARGDSLNLGKIYNNIGHLYMNNDQIDLSLRYYFKSLVAKRKLNDRHGIAVTYNNIGLNYKLANRLDSALDYFNQGLQISLEVNDLDNQSRIINNIGEVYQQKGNLDLAMNQYRKALDLKERFGDRKSQVTTLNNLGKVQLELGQHEGAIKYLERGAKIAGETESKPELRDCYELLALTYQAMDDYRKAFHFQAKSDSVKGKIQDEEKNRILIEMQTKYELENKEREIEVLNKENALFQSNIGKQRIILILTIGGLLLLAVLVFLFYRFNLTNQRTNRMLSHQKEEIEAINRNLVELNDEKNSLIGIVAHDLRSPLNQVRGLTDLIRMNSTSLTAEQKDWLEKVRASSDRMNEMITRILDVEAIETSSVSLDLKKTDLTLLLKKVVEEYGPASRDKNINLACSLPEEVCMLAEENYLSQVLSNLISNAIKFSPPGSLVICNLQEDDKSYQLEIKDQGPGVMQEEMELLFKKFQRLSAQPTANEHSTGLGLYIVKKYMEAMDGEFWCHSIPGEGASFFIKLKKAIS